MEIHRKVIHIMVKLEDLKPTPRKEAKCLLHLKTNQTHKTALSLSIPSDSSPRLINLRHNLLGAKPSLPSGFGYLDIGEKDGNKGRNLEKIRKHKYQSSVSSSKPSVSPLGSVVRNSKENLSSNTEVLSKKLEKYSNIYSLPPNQHPSSKPHTTKPSRVGMKPITNVKS